MFTYHCAEHTSALAVSLIKQLDIGPHALKRWVHLVLHVHAAALFDVCEFERLLRTKELSG